MFRRGPVSLSADVVSDIVAAICNELPSRVKSEVVEALRREIVLLTPTLVGAVLKEFSGSIHKLAEQELQDAKPRDLYNGTAQTEVALQAGGMLPAIDQARVVACNVVANSELVVPITASVGHSIAHTEVEPSWSSRLLSGVLNDRAQRGGYTLIPSTEMTDLSGNPMSPEEEEPLSPLTDPEAAERLPKEIAALEVKRSIARGHLQDLDTHWQHRKQPYEDDMAKIQKEIESLEYELELARMPRVLTPPPPGPRALKFADGGVFAAICNIVVLLNLSAMLIAPKFKSYAHIFKVMDDIFLLWYVVELSIKAVYYQQHLLCGKISIVWWNWLDLGIVLSGVVDQWLIPILMMLNGGHSAIDTSGLSMLRALRLFRIMRFLKIIKAFLKSDLAWTDGPVFETAMACVIAFNSIIMSLELDIPWTGWVYVENLLQIVYTFELSLRLKRQGCEFFTSQDNMVWNYLDFIMVSGGALDLWLMPLLHTLESMIFGTSAGKESSSFTGVLRTLKIMRILRVLRLVRLLKMVKPLYRLLMGVMESLKAMQWVLILTTLTSYACSIVFTNLVGKGLVTRGSVSDQAFEFFGSVPKSLFSLFKLMNGDTSVVKPITNSVGGQLLFAGFMVVSNWAILAILTSVVSDNMISSSQKANEEDAARQAEFDHEKRLRRLKVLFNEIDKDGGGTISTSEWYGIQQDRTLYYELRSATGLEEEVLNDYFECLAQDERQLHYSKVQEDRNKRLDYNTFIDALKDEGTQADKRSILHVMRQLRMLESRMHERLEKAERASFLSAAANSDQQLSMCTT